MNNIDIDTVLSLDPRLPRNWPQYQELLSVESELVDSTVPSGRDLAVSLMQAMYFHGDHEEAAAFASRAHAAWGEPRKPEDTQAMAAASYLGLFLWALGRYSEAAELNQRMLDLCPRVFGVDSAEMVVAELRVAVDTRIEGDFNAARKRNEQAYERAVLLFRDIHNKVRLQAAHDLAVSMRLCGDYQAALVLNRDTSRLRASEPDSDGPDHLNTLSGVYVDRRELGEHEQARAGLEWIAVRRRRDLGEDAPATLQLESYLAVARRKDGDHREALQLSQRTLDGLRKRYRPDHPVVLACAVGHSADLRDAGLLDDAHRVAEKAERRYRKSLGTSHPHTLLATANVAVLYRLAGEAEKARKRDKEALDSLRATLGYNHPHAIACSINLASDYAELNRVEEAIALNATAHDQAQETLGSSHPLTIAAGLNLALDRSRHVVGEPSSHRARNVRATVDLDPLPL